MSVGPITVRKADQINQNRTGPKIDLARNTELRTGCSLRSSRQLDPAQQIIMPPKIKSFISSVTATPLEDIEVPLKSFFWDFDKGDFHHWVDLFNHFDTFFEKFIKPRKDLHVEDNFLECDAPFPREAVLQILRVVRIVLDNCSNKHFYSTYEHHLSSLLASTDADVVEACLQTLSAFLRKSIGKHVIRDASLSSKLFAFAQGWGGKDEALGLVACATETVSDPVALELGSTLHFEFYAGNESLKENSDEQATQGLQIIHLPEINTYEKSDLELLHKLVDEYKVPRSLRFSLLTRLRFARAFSSFTARQQYTCIRLHAFVVLVQACGDTDDLVTFFNAEPEFINELVTLLSYEDAVPEKIRILSVFSLVALSQDRSRQSTVLSAVTSGGHRGILSSLMQKAIDSVVSKSSKWSVLFAEALLSLVTVLVSSSSGCSAMREAGFIPTLLPLLKNTDPQHLHLVSTAVHVLEAFMDYSNPAATLFRDLGGLDDTISRLKIEVSHVENGTSVQMESSGSSGTSELDSMQPLYSEALVSYHRRSLMKALLRAISLGTYAPGTTTRVYGSEESLLPQCLHAIFKKAKDFGGGMFSLAAIVMSDLIHKDPTCYSILEEAGLPSAFLDAIIEGVVCSAEAITCIPQCLDALCLNNSGLQAVKDRNALRCFVKIFTSRNYLRALMGDTPSSLSSGLDELMRHNSSLRGHGVDILIEILKAIEKLGSGSEVVSSTSEASSSSVVPMETDADDKSVAPRESGESSNTDNPEKQPEPSSDTSSLNTESFIFECVNNAARLLETVLQNSDTCRIFVDKKGIEAVLQLFTLPLMPSYISVGQSISVAFKSFSPHHSASLARVLCVFLREHLKVTNELLVSLGGMQIAQVEESKRTKVLRCLSSLEGILSLSNSLSKGTTNLVSELGTSDADVLKDLGVSYREVLWQVSVCCDTKVDEKPVAENVDANTDTASAASNTAERESDDDASIPVVRYMNPVSARNSTHPHWGLERDFVSVVRSGEGFSRRNRHGLARIRGGRTGRHLEALHIDPEASSSNAESSSSQEIKKKSPEVLVMENLNKLASTMRSFFTTLVKGFPSSNRRRAETGSLVTASKNIGTALAKIFLEALSFSGYTMGSGLDTLLSVKCHYLGKVVDHMAALTFDSRRRICYAVMINNFYVQGTFKELLNTFEATSQLLWTMPHCASSSSIDHDKSEGSKLSHSKWLLDTLQSYCRLLEFFVNSTFLLPQTSASQAQLLVQPVAVGLSIGLFPVPRDPEAFVRMLQSQVLDVILPVWNHPMFPSCNPGFITTIVTLVTHIYCGVGDAKRSRSGGSGSGNQRFMPPPPDEATITTIVEMGFTRARAEEALRRVETNRNSSETPKVDNLEKPTDVPTEVAEAKTPPIDDILSATMKLFQSNESMAFPLTDLLVTFCNRNKGEDRPKVISYLIQQLKLCPVESSKETGTLCMISHILALLLAEDVTAREMAVKNGIVSISIDILMKFLAGTESQEELLVPKCISALLLILDNLLQSRPKLSPDSKEGSQAGSLPNSKEEQGSLSVPQEGTKENPTLVDMDKEKGSVFETIFGKSTGYLTIEEGGRVLAVACDLIKRHVPAMVMQAVLLLCARLTKTHTLAIQFLENGGMVDLFSIPKTCFFPGYDTVASAIIRHLIEDPQTLQTAMELEVRQALSGSRHAGRVPPRVFLTSMAPLISRDPEVFMKAATAVCQIDSTGGRTVLVLSKEKEKEKDKSKAPGVEIGTSSTEGVRIPETKSQDGATKCGKSQKKIPANLTQVVDHLLEIVMKYPSLNPEENCTRSDNAMEIDNSIVNKGKTKVDDTKKELDSVSEKSAGLAKVTFVLKLLSDILLMYVHAVGIILKRDLEMCQLRNGGIVHHVMHRLLHPSIDKTSGSDEWGGKLSEKASWFLVVLCGRSSEGRRRVINVLVKALSSFASSASNSSKGSLLPDKRVLAFVDLVYSILSKNSSSSNVPGSGCSPDIAKGMIDGGMIPCLSSILQVLDLDHPDATKAVNIILKALEGLTRAANAVEQLALSDLANKKKSVSLGTASDNQMVTTPVNQIPEGTSNSNQHEITSTDDAEQHNEETTQDEGNHQSNLNQPSEQGLRIDMDEAENVGFMHEEMEDGGVLGDSDQIEMTFHVESRGGNNTGDEDDDMGDDGEDDEDDDDGDDEDEDIAEDGTALMSLADTDVEDHDETGLGDEYNDDMVDEEEDDDYHENRVIEVRWREALDGVLGQPGADTGLIDIAAEPFEGVNVDDLFGLRRPLAFDRRRQQSRTSFERSNTEGNNSLQHPLLLRPSQSNESGVIYSSGGVSSSRDLESLSGGSFDVSHFYMFDAPVLPFDHAFGDRVGGPPPLSDFSVGLESLRAPPRRGPGDGRWTDDGQPQAGGQAAAIAQAVEEHFMSQLHSVAPSSSSVERNSLNSESLANDNQQVVEVADTDTQQSDPNTIHQELNQSVENAQHSGGQSHGPTPNVGNNALDSMEIGEGNESVNEQQELPATDDLASNHPLVNTDNTIIAEDADVDMNVVDSEASQGGDALPSVGVVVEPLSEQNTSIAQDIGQSGQSDETGATNAASNANGIDPTFLEALPADLRAEVLASQQAQSAPAPVSAPAPTPTPSTAEEIDPEFLAALPPDIQAEVLAQQRAQRVAHQAEGQPVDMDNASIIATFPADLREEVLLTSSEAVLSALPSPLLAEAQMLRDRAMSHYQARSLFGNSHRLNNRRNGLGFDRQTVIDRGVGVTIGRRTSSALLESLKVKEVEGDPLLDPDALKSLIRLLRLAQPLGKGLLQRLFLNLSAHSSTRAVLVYLLLGMIKMETEGSAGGLTTVNSQRLYGCQSNVVYGRSQLLNGLPPLVLRRVLEILTYLATNHSSVANLLFYFDSSLVPESLNSNHHDKKNDKGKEKVVEGGEISHPVGSEGDIPILLFVKLLKQPLFLRSIAHLEQVMGLLQVVVYTAASKLESQSHTEKPVASSQVQEAVSQPQEDSSSAVAEPNQDDKSVSDGLSTSDDLKKVNMNDIFMKLPQTDLHNLCSLLGHEGLSDKVYLLTGEVLKKLASVASSHRKFFIVELSDLAHSLSGSAISELITLRNTQMLGLSSGSMAGAAVLRILQTLSSLTVPDIDDKVAKNDDNQEHVTMWKLNLSLEPLWQELSECISVTESQLAQGSLSSVMSNVNTSEHVQGTGASSPPLPPGTQRLLPFIEAFLVLCEKLQASSSLLQQDDAYATASEVKELSGSSSPSAAGVDGAVTFSRFAEKHRRLLNAFVRQNPGLLEKSLSMMLKAPRLIDFDNKRSYFRSRIRQQHDQHLTGPLRISVRRAYVLEDSYNQLRMRPTQDLKGRLNVHFQGEEGIDAGGLTREWYQLLSRVIFDKGALLFTTGGNNATFQPNPNSVYQTEHLSYFKFVGRVVAKALFDGQLLDVYFTRSFYKHILGVKVTYHDIEAVDPDYYKNLKWLLENDVSDILDLTFSMDADEEKQILYEKSEVTDHELKPGGRNIRVTEETKHEYVDLVAEHILTNAIRPQINSFLEGFNELIPRDLISIFNDKELELLISGLPEIDLDDLKANTEYTGYTVGTNVVIWFWEVVKAFNKEDRARLLQFVTGTSKVPLEGFKALQGISGPQRFQIHKAYGAPERLPSAHTCFNQLDLPEYTSKEQLQERLLLAIHEASEGFGFG
ncbi:HECT domain-containing protein [Artemisia annua]|uniref:HECT-type E3 ubiquitin transferase n=1 Tax=Artemisia annua TaxID=35608 RepID=A0A2U1PSK8_ARTAN|nr:HECT domain-containing protein [Artemisia annua]